MNTEHESSQKPPPPPLQTAQSKIAAQALKHSVTQPPSHSTTQSLSHSVSRLPGGPSHLSAAHHVQVQVVHGLRALLPVVDHHAEPARLQALLDCVHSVSVSVTLS